eukprot:CAMPEP_0182416362 /NCGR_PEP_ID=MMETSP1167-20130531/641_1 /TAXON_ID=2988 /ORGANISM="Mallomonas Sp, Strain CCMP3275" /LENGTH=85 /DNA_ID=CAMNT_0024589055 /DNA_START=80 /DNA_END=337 /DNA_ORIENTATION=+
MQNSDGVNVDLYIPRKCSWTNRILAANDFGAAQINVAKIDPQTGLYTKSYDTYAISGVVRSRSEGDDALIQLVRKQDAENLGAAV